MKKLIYLIIIVFALILLSLSIFNFNKKDVNKMELKSSVFSEGGKILGKFTCDGDNVNPQLEISNVPENAKSLVLIMDDPDAVKLAEKVWAHWTVWNINPDTKVIEENTVPQGSVQGITDFGNVRYGGPCPPDGEHKYFFKLYALDITLDLKEGSTKQEVEKAMEGHIIEKIELTGTYVRV